MQGNQQLEALQKFAQQRREKIANENYSDNVSWTTLTTSGSASPVTSYSAASLLNR